MTAVCHEAMSLQLYDIVETFVGGEFGFRVRKSHDRTVSSSTAIPEVSQKFPRDRQSSTP